VNGKITVNLRAEKQLYLCLMSVNALEAIRFYVSFACSFAFAERKLMEGNAKIIRLIARDEALHLTGTQHMLNLLRSGTDDPEMAEIAEECKQECYDLFVLAAQQEKEWADYLFRDGSMIGLNKDPVPALSTSPTSVACRLSVLTCRSRRALTRSRGSTPGWCPITCRLRRRKWK
jgi:ribonucleoside-diphosphate reductase beta chain